MPLLNIGTGRAILNPRVGLSPLPPYTTGLRGLFNVFATPGFTDDGSTVATNGQAVRRTPNIAPGWSAAYAEQTTESSRKLYLATDGINGGPCWRFDGVDDFEATVASLNLSTWWACIVAKPAIIVGDSGWMVSNFATVNTSGFLIGIDDRGSPNSDNSIRCVSNAGAGANRNWWKDGSYPEAAWKIFATGFAGGTGNVLTQNGVDLAPYDSSTSGTGTPVQFTGNFVIGSQGGGAFPIAMDFSIGAFYDSIPTTEQQASVVRWANAWAGGTLLA